MTERATDDREVADLNPTGAAWKLGQVRLAHIACVFWMIPALYAVGPVHLMPTPQEVKCPTQGEKCTPNSEINHYSVSHSKVVLSISKRTKNN